MKLVLIPVGDSVKRNSRLLQPLDDLDAARNLAAKRFMPALVIGTDHRMKRGRLALGERGDRVREAAATVLLDVPGWRADIGKEPFHLLDAAAE